MIDSLERINQWIDRNLECLPGTYDYKQDPYSYFWKAALIRFKQIAEQSTPIQPKPPVIPFKVGQVLRRTSDGLKCLIHRERNGAVYLVQLNNGLQFADVMVGCSGLDVTPEQLLRISGGYTFVTESKGREMGLAWAKNPGAETNCDRHYKMSMKEFGGGTYSQH